MKRLPVPSVRSSRSSRSSQVARACAAACLVLGGALPASVDASSIEVSVNAWIGGTSSDWFDTLNWESGIPGLISLPYSYLPTAIGPVRLLFNGIPTGQYHLPQSEAVLAASFSTPSFSMVAWDGISQVRLKTGALLTANSASIGAVATEYTPSGPIQAATVVLDGGQTAGNWQFLANSRVVVNSQYAQGQSNWSGTVGSLEIASGGSFLLNSGLTVNSLVNNSNSLTVAAGAAFNAGGSLANNGTLTLAGNSSQGTARMYLTGDTTLSGAGTTQLTASGSTAYGGYVSTGSHTLTIASGQTVRGIGTLAGRFVNQGTVIADGPLELSLYNGTGTTFDNTAGLVQVSDGATLTANSGTLFGGTVQSLGSAKLAGQATFTNLVLKGNFTASGSGIYTGVTITDNLTVAAGGNIQLTGTINNNGTLAASGNASNGTAHLYFSGNTLLAGNGTTVLSGSGGYSGYLGNSGTLTIGSAQTVRGSGMLTGGIVNQGTVIADGSLAVSLWNGTPTAFDNTAGLVLLGDASTLTVESGTLFGGTLRSTGSSATLNGGATLNGVLLQGNIKASSGSYTGVTIADSLTVAPGGYINLAGTLTNNGTLAVGGNASNGTARLYLNGDTLLAGSGTTVLSSSGGYTGYLGAGSHTLTIGSGQTVRGTGSLSGSFVNQGTVIADGALDLVLYNGTPTPFDNRAGLVQVGANGTLAVSSGTLWGGTVQGLGNGSKLVGGTYRDVTLAGTLAVAPGGNVMVGGTLVNNGRLSVDGNASTGSASLTLAADTLLTGNGQTWLTAAGGYGGRINTGGHTLTMGSAQTLRGSGTLTGGFVNQGTVIADGSLALSLYNGNALTFDNGAGLIHVSDGATLTVGSGALVGGSIQSLGSGKLAGNATFKDVLLTGNFSATGSGTYTGMTNTGTLTVAPGGNIYTRGMLTNAGTLAIGGNSSHGAATLYLGADTLLAGAGTTVLSTSNGYAGSINTGGYTLTIGNAQTVRGTGTLTGSFVNQGTVVADGSLALTLYNGAPKTFDNRAGLVQVANNATLSVSSGTLLGGTVQGLGTGSKLTGGTYQDVALTGTLAVAPGSTVTAAGTLTNDGRLTVAGNASYGSSTLALAADTVLSGTGQTWLTTSGSYGGRINTGAYTLTLAHGAMLGGSGTVTGTLASHGTLAPAGNEMGIGKLTLAGNLTLGDDALLAIDAAGLTQGSLYDWLAVSGNASLDGAVQLDFGSFSAKVGDSFTFLTFAGTRTGSFDTVNATGYQLSLSYGAHDVTATVTAITPVPEPGTWALMTAGLLAVGGIARRRRA